MTGAYDDLIASYEADEGYPAESWIDKFLANDHLTFRRDVPSPAAPEDIRAMNGKCSYDDCPYPDCLVDGKCPSRRPFVEA